MSDRIVGNDYRGEPVIIDAADQALLSFTEQFEYRERFLHALEEIQRVDMADPLAHQKMRAIADDALDIDSIRRWTAEGRPLPWLDEELGDRVAQAQAAVAHLFA